ncbi:hypothetical protein [Afifella pfennigii]|uniref:hypothetical protein n=1 Tax=Afifella pfennigii TaxID=209897 RepID=UPI0005591CDD|nr:hypothetical protein [Afifella pfennigii]
MQKATLYQTVLLELYDRFSHHSLPEWVADGLVEEGLAQRAEGGELHLKTPITPFRLRPLPKPSLVVAGA